MQIEMGKKYRLVRTHEPVRIICVDRRHPDYTCIGLVQSSGVLGESPLSFNSSGSANGIQIVEEVPTVDWAKVAVDTPIIVKSDTGYNYRHLACFVKGLVCYYPDGKTTHSHREHGGPLVCASPDMVTLAE